MARWLLPEYITDVLPVEARQVEALRRQLLDLYRAYGYELVMPPMLEYLDSLLTGTGQDLNLRTFKLVDQISGKTMGVRADITPQVARIDAHLLNRSGVVRLSYAGSVLHTQPAGLNATRELIQVGAELYGHAGLEADMEIAELALASLAKAQVPNPRLDLSHAGVIRALLLDAQLTSAQTEDVVSLVSRKDIPGLGDLSVGGPTLEILTSLCHLYGEATDVIERARRCLPQSAAIQRALGELEQLALFLQRTGVQVTVDLGDMRGYRYHSGVVFAIYCDTVSEALVRGGRYDEVGQAFGRSRPATGFSLDIRELARLSAAVPPVQAIRAPWGDDPELLALIARLRADGEVVIQILPGHETEWPGCRYHRALEKTREGWEIVFLENA